MHETVFVLDDEQDILDLVILHLSKNGYQARGFGTSAALLKALARQKPDLILLDLMLPDLDGLEVCKRLKADSGLKGIPVIMLTAKRDETDKVVGLELGADDYVTKPFSPRELMARVKAVLRRGREDKDTAGVIAVGRGIFIDLERHEVRDGKGKTIEMTPTEFGILSRLAGRRGWVFPRERLLSDVWGNDVYVTDRNIDVHIRHLRAKLGAAGGLIVNVRGVGYKLAE
jgi:DNA-binding response OmpR family regulator